jgi:hypothetical protein
LKKKGETKVARHQANIFGGQYGEIIMIEVVKILFESFIKDQIEFTNNILKNKTWHENCIYVLL